MENLSLRDRLIDFNAAYARCIDSDTLESWPQFFTPECHYRVTSAASEREGLPAGLMYATSRAMLEDRILSLRVANVYERQRYRHMLGLPHVVRGDASEVECETPFMVVRIVQDDVTSLFVTGLYKDVFDLSGGKLQLKRRVVVADSSRFDTLLVVPL
jgi:3-phenylpropionate/cinnamic acid dioxygenase small subunit